jgi:hypothetical protein
MDKKDVCIVRAKLKKDYVFDAIQHYGYQIYTPYKGNSILLRIMREAWFRLKLPYQKIWYNARVRKADCKVFVVFDPLILPDYLDWIKGNHPDSQIILSYENRADRTINPDCVSKFVEKWSYDQDDCKRYSMKWSSPSFFMEYKRTPRQNPKYDVVYVGRDKGRAGQLLQLERELNDKGLRTYFHICADRQFLKFKRKYYKKLLTYEEYLDLLIDTKAVLNVVPEGQRSITQREMEAVFDGIKCITNNRGIHDFELYDKNTYFILGEDSFDELDVFLNRAVKEVSNERIKKFDFDQKLKMMIHG